MADRVWEFGPLPHRDRAEGITESSASASIRAERARTYAQRMMVEPPYDGYAAAIVEIMSGRRRIVLTPVKTPDANADAHRRLRVFLGGSSLPAWVITAHNPHPQFLSAGENDRRNRSLAGRLAAGGIVHLPAVGRSVDGQDREEGFALFGCSRQDALDLAGAFGQIAIFGIETHIECIAVADGRSMTRRAYEVSGDVGRAQAD
jgi:hypothetical protein